MNETGSLIKEKISLIRKLGFTKKFTLFVLVQIVLFSGLVLFGVCLDKMGLLAICVLYLAASWATIKAIFPAGA